MNRTRLLTLFVAWTSLSTSAALPNIALRVIELRGAPSATALYFLLSSAGGLISLLVVERKRFQPSAVALFGLAWSAGGYLLLSLMPNTLGFVCVGVAISLGAALPVSQYFALIGFLSRAEGSPPGLVSRVRALYAAVYIIGASIGGIVGATVGSNLVFLVIGAGSAVASIGWRFSLQATPSESQNFLNRKFTARKSNRVPSKNWVTLNVFLAGVALVSAGGQYRASTMPAYYLADANVPKAMIGWVLGTAPLAEVPLLWMLPWIVRKFGARVSMVVGTASGVLFFLIAVFTRNALTALSSQLLFGVFAASAMALALEITQSQAAEGTQATTRFFAWTAASALVGGGAATLTASFLPLRDTFIPPFYLGVAGLILVVGSLVKLPVTTPQPLS